MRTRTVFQLNQAYGFLPAEPLPFSAAGRIPHPPFAVTADFASLAKNHCCATMVTNFILQGYAELPADRSDPTGLFRTVHRFVGNGPVFTLRRVNRYLVHAGCSGRFHRIPGSQLMSVLQSGQPAALLVAASPFDWHWVLAVGISGNHHIQIINNWDRTTLKTFLPNHRARILSVWICR